MNASWYISLAMERYFFLQHPVDNSSELSSSGYDSFALPFLVYDAAVEPCEKALATSHMYPGALYEEESNGGWSPFGDVAMVGGI
mgnify:CR=1 FL=1